MSRIGKKPIPLPSGTQARLEADVLHVQGKLGSAQMKIPADLAVKITQSDLQLDLSAQGGEMNKRLGGTVRANMANMILGVSSGFERKLNLVGVGFRAQAQGNTLNLQIGFSHPVSKSMPQGIKVETPSQTEILIKGADCQRVGQVAAEIRALRPPEPYKGKGIRYDGERVVLKETKKK